MAPCIPNRKQPHHHGGVVLVALITLSFGAVGALAFVQLIATRALHSDSSFQALERRVILGNSRSLAKQYLLGDMLAQPFAEHQTTGKLIEIEDGTSRAWAQFEMGTLPSNADFVGTATPLTKTRTSNTRTRNFLNRAGYGHNGNAFTIRLNPRIGDGGGALGEGLLALNPDEVGGGPTDVSRDIVRLNSHRMTFFLKARSPLLAGDTLYTADTNAAGVAPVIGNAVDDFVFEGDVYHANAVSFASSNYSSVGPAKVGYEPLPGGDVSGVGPGVSNFPDVVHTWGAGGAGAFAGAFPGALAAERRLLSLFDAGEVSNYLQITSGTEPADSDLQTPEGVSVADKEVLALQRVAYGTGTSADFAIRHQSYNLSTGLGTATSDPEHGSPVPPENNGRVPYPFFFEEDGTNPPARRPSDAAVSQVWREKADGSVINTLRIDLTNANAQRPILVKSGVEELELIGDGTYNGVGKLTDPFAGPVVIVFNQPDVLSKVRFYGTANRRLLYLYFGNAGAAAPQIEWWWHGAEPILAGASSPPEFRLYAELENSPLRFQFRNVLADVRIRGGFATSGSLVGGVNGNRVTFAPETLSAFDIGLGNTVGVLERAMARVGWLEAYTTLGLEGSRPGEAISP